MRLKLQLKIKLIFALLRIKLDYKFRSENKFRYVVQNLIKKVKKIDSIFDSVVSSIIFEPQTYQIKIRRVTETEENRSARLPS